MAVPGTTTTASQRLCAAIAARDIDAISGQFADDYVNETPAHPSRGFQGAAQVRQNWTRILAAVQDLRVELVRQAVEGDVEWAEWSFTGTKADGSPFAMAGVVIVGVGDGVIRWARFYLEPVDDETGPVSPESTVAAAVSQHLGTS